MWNPNYGYPAFTILGMFFGWRAATTKCFATIPRVVEQPVFWNMSKRAGYTHWLGKHPAPSRLCLSQYSPLFARGGVVRWKPQAQLCLAQADKKEEKTKEDYGELSPTYSPGCGCPVGWTDRTQTLALWLLGEGFSTANSSDFPSGYLWCLKPDILHQGSPMDPPRP